jgi:hypothetical protein
MLALALSLDQAGVHLMIVGKTTAKATVAVTALGIGVGSWAQVAFGAVTAYAPGNAGHATVTNSDDYGPNRLMLVVDDACDNSTTVVQYFLESDQYIQLADENGCSPGGDIAEHSQPISVMSVCLDPGPCAAWVSIK